MAGWMTAEIGRQPWVVWKILRTPQGVSPNISAGEVVGSLIMLGTIYIGLFITFLYLLDRKIKHGPLEESEGDLIYHKTHKGQ